jgi:hypothetical protein
MQAKGEAIVQIDADSQDPSHTIFDLLNGWENGFKVVVGDRGERCENFFSKFRKFEYSFYRKLQDLELSKCMKL